MQSEKEKAYKKSLSTGAMLSATFRAASGCGPVGHVSTLVAQILSSTEAETEYDLYAQAQLAAENKPGRDVYVGNFSKGTDLLVLTQFMNKSIIDYNLQIMSGDAAIGGWLSTDSLYAFVEFRTLEECHNALMLNGVIFNNCQLKIGRPQSVPNSAKMGALLRAGGPGTVAGTRGETLLNPQLIAPPEVIAGHGGTEAPPHPPSLVLKTRISSPFNFSAPVASLENLPKQGNQQALIQDSELFTKKTTNETLFPSDRPTRKIIIQGTLLDDLKIVELLQRFGALLFYQIVCSTYLIFFEFEELADQEDFLKYMEKQGKTCGFVVKTPEEAIDTGLVSMSQLLLSAQTELGTAEVAPWKLYRRVAASRVLYLINMIAPENEGDEELLIEIADDIRMECARYGKVLSLHMPGKDEGVKAAGYVFIEFETTTGAAKAKKGLSGRKFSGRVVEANYFNEEKYMLRDFKEEVAPNYVTDRELLQEQYEQSLRSNQLDGEIVD